MVFDGGGVDFIHNVVHARRLKLSIIVVLAPTRNIFKGDSILLHQLTSERIASHNLCLELMPLLIVVDDAVSVAVVSIFFLFINRMCVFVSFFMFWTCLRSSYAYIHRNGKPSHTHTHINIMMVYYYFTHRNGINGGKMNEEEEEEK